MTLNVTTIYKIIFELVALVLSVGTSWHMLWLHGAGAKINDFAGKHLPDRMVSNWERATIDAELVHDFILNLVGCAIGWQALFYLVFFRFGVYGCPGITDLVIIWIAFAGILGYLPHVVINKGIKF